MSVKLLVVAALVASFTSGPGPVLADPPDSVQVWRVYHTDPLSDRVEIDLDPPEEQARMAFALVGHQMVGGLPELFDGRYSFYGGIEVVTPYAEVYTTEPERMSVRVLDCQRNCDESGFGISGWTIEGTLGLDFYVAMMNMGSRMPTVSAGWAIVAVPGASLVRYRGQDGEATGVETGRFAVEAFRDASRAGGAGGSVAFGFLNCSPLLRADPVTVGTGVGSAVLSGGDNYPDARRTATCGDGRPVTGSSRAATTWNFTGTAVGFGGATRLAIFHLPT